MIVYKHSVLLDADKCKGCTTCLRRCPTQAIRIRDGKACINPNLCIDCGECIRHCPYKAKKADFDTWDSLNRSKFLIALPAPSLFGQFANLDDADYLMQGLMDLGFSDIFEVAKAAELVTDYTRAYMQRMGDAQAPFISTACPVVVRLISLRFPTLRNKMVPVAPPIELAGKLAKERALERHPDLKPEDAWLFDIGIDWHPALGDNWTLGLKVDGYYNTLKDKIISAPSADDPWIWLPYNVGKVDAKGIDASLSLRYDNGTFAGGLSARYARQSALDKTPDSYTFNQQIPYIAKNTVVLAADAAIAGWRLDAVWNWRAGRFDASGEMPDWDTLDLSLRKDFQLGKVGVLGLNISVRDLLDCRYELVRDYPMPGRSILGGFTFKF